MVLAKGLVFFGAGVAGKKFHQSFVGALVLKKDGVVVFKGTGKLAGVTIAPH